MTNKIREQAGFTLIELLVVILIIGILAAIALPAFLDQRDKGHDTQAKTHVRLLVGEMEECFSTAGGDYATCWTQITANSLPVPIGTTEGRVAVTFADANSYTIEAVSRAKGGGSNHRYRVLNDVGGVSGRFCSPAGKGGCKTDGSW